MRYGGSRSITGSAVVSFLWHFGVVVASGWILYMWETLFNYPTTHEPAITLFGDTEIVRTLAQIIVAVDVLFLAHSLLKAFVWKSDGESFIDAYLNDKVAVSMASAWMLTTATDLFFTWFYLQGQMQETGISNKIPVDVLNVLKAFPILFSLLSWVAQAALIVSLARSLQQMVEIIKNPTKPAMYSNQNQNQNRNQQNHQPFHRPNHQPTVQHVPHNQNQTQRPKPVPVPRASWGPVDPRNGNTYVPVSTAERDELDFSE